MRPAKPLISDNLNDEREFDFPDGISGNSEFKWFTTEEAAEYLRIHPGTLRNMVSNGTIKPSGKIGRLNRFLESDLRKLLLANA